MLSGCAYLSPSRLWLKAFNSFVTMAMSSWSSGINSMAGTVLAKLFFRNIRELEGRGGEGQGGEERGGLSTLSYALVHYTIQEYKIKKCTYVQCIQ